MGLDTVFWGLQLLTFLNTRVCIFKKKKFLPQLWNNLWLGATLIAWQGGTMPQGFLCIICVFCEICFWNYWCAIFLWLKKCTKKIWLKSALQLETHWSIKDQSIVWISLYQYHVMSYGSHFRVKCAYAGHLATLISFYKRVIYKCHGLWRNEIALYTLCLYRVHSQWRHCMYYNLLVLCSSFSLI